jgi:hypothetical protein
MYQTFPIADIEGLLNRFVKNTQNALQGRGEYIPLVVLSLRNGQRVQGVPLEIQRPSQFSLVVLKSLQLWNELYQDTTLVFVRMDEIIALELMHASAANFLNSDSGSYSRKIVSLTKLEARRQYEALRPSHPLYSRLEIDWESFRNEEIVWGSLIQFVPTLVKYLEDLGQDSEGQACLNRLQAVQLKGGAASPSPVSLDSHCLKIELHEKDSEIFDPVALKAKLDRLF